MIIIEGLENSFEVLLFPARLTADISCPFDNMLGMDEFQNNIANLIK